MKDTAEFFLCHASRFPDFLDFSSDIHRFGPLSHLAGMCYLEGIIPAACASSKASNA